MLVTFYLFCVFCVAKLFLKKIWNCPKFVLITSFIILTCTTLNPTIENFFATNLAPFFCTTFIFENLFFSAKTHFHLSVKISSYLSEPMFICIEIFLFMITCRNLFFCVKNFIINLLKSLLTSTYPFLSLRMFCLQSHE